MLARKRNQELPELLAEVNAHISAYAAEANLSDQVWEFICECGNRGCQERVSLPLSDYKALKQSGDPVLAKGHTLDRSVDARARARRLLEDCQAIIRAARERKSR
jgi:hypothetical protein